MIGVKEVVYKTRKVKAEYCTVCETFLSGNGSLILPWKCECGEYKFDWSGGWSHPKPKKEGK